MWENAQAIELWIRNLGKSHSSLIHENLIPALPLKRLYDDSNSLGIEPCPGVELNFWFETQRFEEVVISLIPLDPSIHPPYSGSLPSPFDRLKSSADVHAEFGKPYKSNGAMAWETDGVSFAIGGWDFYELNENLHPNCQVEFQYDKTLNVSLLSFSLFDKES